MVIQIMGAIVLISSISASNGLGVVCGLVMVAAGCLWGDNNSEK